MKLINYARKEFYKNEVQKEIRQRSPGLFLCLHSTELLEALGQALANYGPLRTLMWPATYVCSFLNSYFDFGNMLNIQKMSALSYKQP